jgi:uncharacterized protein (TIGR02246 family)
LNRDSIAAFNRGDVAACAGFYAEDATLLLPDRPPVKGRKAIEEALKAYAASGVELMPVEPVEIVSSDDLGCCAGTYRFQAPGEHGAPVTGTGKFVTVFRQQRDGSWKAVIDSFFGDTEPES